MDVYTISTLALLLVFVEPVEVNDLQSLNNDTEAVSSTQGEPTTVNVFYQQHPHNVILNNAFYTYLNISWSPPEDDQDIVLKYVVYFTDGLAEECPLKNEHIQKEVGNTSTTVIIKGLQPGTSYSVCVQASFSSGLQTESEAEQFPTDGFGGPHNPCDCDLSGVTDDKDKCDSHNGTCICKSKIIAGSKCDECVPSYYKHDKLACEPCHCDTDRSNGSCYTGHGGVKMCHCYMNYKGPRCQSCKNGYFNKAGKCLPCHCSENLHPNATKMCASDTGKCVDCWYHTAGDECEKCKPGYMGSAVNKTCVPESHHHVRVAQHSHMGTGAIIVTGLVIGAILVVITILIIYNQRHRKNPFKLWRVHLLRGREDVNFSQMMENEWEDTDAYSDLKRDNPEQNRLQLQTDGSNKIYRAINT